MPNIDKSERKIVCNFIVKGWKTGENLKRKAKKGIKYRSIAKKMICKSGKI
jgi:hypothetical protein